MTVCVDRGRNRPPSAHGYLIPNIVSMTISEMTILSRVSTNTPGYSVVEDIRLSLVVVGELVRIGSTFECL